MHMHTHNPSRAPQLMSCNYNVRTPAFLISLHYDYIHPIASNLPMKALVARQLQTNMLTILFSHFPFTIALDYS